MSIYVRAEKTASDATKHHIKFSWYSVAAHGFAKDIK